MIRLLAGLLVLLSAVRTAVVPQLCNLVCSTNDPTCLNACAHNVTNLPAPYFGAPWLRLRTRFPLGKLHDHVTGCSAPLNSDKTNVYFTTLEGRLYQYRNDTVGYKLIFELPQHYQLNTSNGKGLYDVAFHRKYEQNGIFYLHFSANAPEGASLTLTSDIRSSGRPQAFQFVVDHYNVITKHRKYNDAILDLGELTRFAQLTPDRSGGWMNAALREGWGWYEEDPLFVALGGNSEENIIYGSELSYLSTIRRLDAEKPKNEYTWASGTANPISCSSTLFKAGEIMCLVQQLDGSRALYRVKKGTNIGRPEYVLRCEGLACAADKKRNDTSALEVFLKGERCPVTSILHYSGYRMDKFKTHLFLSRDACYLPRFARFDPAQLLRLVKNSTSGEWYSSVMPTDFEDNFLIDTKLVGADKHNDFFFSGFSLRTGKLTFYSIDPVRAANNYLDDDYDEAGVLIQRDVKPRRRQF